jgi:hypothetical protein
LDFPWEIPTKEFARTRLLERYEVRSKAIFVDTSRDADLGRCDLGVGYALLYLVFAVWLVLPVARVAGE